MTLREYVASEVVRRCGWNLRIGGLVQIEESLVSLACPAMRLYPRHKERTAPASSSRLLLRKSCLFVVRILSLLEMLAWTWNGGRRLA